MVCSHCGRQIETTYDNCCSFCGTLLINPNDSMNIPEEEDYETVVGFSRPDSKYIKAQVDSLDNTNDNNKDSSEESKTTGKMKRVSYRLLLGVFSVAIMILFYRNEISDNKIYTMVSQDAIEVFSDATKNETYIFNSKTDGETMTYTTIPTASLSLATESFIISKGGSPELMGKDIVLVGASEDGKYFYYIDYKDGVVGALYAKQGKKSLKLSESIMSYVRFNLDMSEIMFSSDGKTYVCIEGKETKLISDTLLKDIIIPKKCIVNKTNVGPILYGIDSFENKVVICEDNSLRLIGDHYETKEISSTADNNFTAISDEGNDLLYSTANLSIIKVSDLLGEFSQSICIEHWGKTVASDDLTQIYYTNGSKLYYVTGKGTSNLIAEGITDLCLNSSGDTAFFLKDMKDGVGTLYYSIQGKNAEPVEGGGSVEKLYEWGYGIAYREKVGEDYNIYYNTEGTEFKLILENVSPEV